MILNKILADLQSSRKPYKMSILNLVFLINFLAYKIKKYHKKDKSCDNNSTITITLYLFYDISFFPIESFFSLPVFMKIFNFGYIFTKKVRHLN